jgi:hypothetical protein
MIIYVSICGSPPAHASSRKATGDHVRTREQSGRFLRRPANQASRTEDAPPGDKAARRPSAFAYGPKAITCVPASRSGGSSLLLDSWRSGRSPYHPPTFAYGYGLRAITCARAPGGSSGVLETRRVSAISYSPGRSGLRGRAGRDYGRGSSRRLGCLRPVRFAYNPQAIMCAPASRSGGSSLACSWRSGCSPPIHLPVRHHSDHVRGHRRDGDGEQ